MGFPPRGSHFYKYACSWVYLPLVQDILLSEFRVENWKEALIEVKWEKPTLARASEIKEKGGVASVRICEINLSMQPGMSLSDQQCMSSSLL